MQSQTLFFPAVDPGEHHMARPGAPPVAPPVLYHILIVTTVVDKLCGRSDKTAFSFLNGKHRLYRQCIQLPITSRICAQTFLLSTGQDDSVCELLRETKTVRNPCKPDRQSALRRRAISRRRHVFSWGCTYGDSTAPTIRFVA